MVDYSTIKLYEELIMFENLKKSIKELAKTAVVMAEKALGSEMGKQKKEMAVAYVVSRIPVPVPIRPLISLFFTSFIDDAVEFAVEYMEEI